VNKSNEGKKMDKTIKELKRIKKDQDAILNHVPAIIFFKNKENRYLRVNKAFAKLMRVSEKKLEGQSLFKLFPKKQAESSWIDDKEIISTGLPKMNIIHPMDIKRETRWFQTDKIPYRDEDGNTIGVIGFAIDITERKNTETILHDSEMRFRRLFESAQDGILILDAQTGKIDEVNPFIIDMLGFTHKELLGKKLWEIGAFVDINKSKVAFKTIQREGYVRYENMPLRTKDGHLIKVEFVSNLYKVNHHSVIQCNIRDITERKELEAYNKKEGILSEEKRKTEFIADATHELRTPLAIIRGTVDLAMLEGSKKSKSSISTFKAINHEVEHLSELLSDLTLLTTSSSSSSITLRRKIRVQKINLSILVKKTTDACKKIAFNKHITIKTDKIPDAFIMGDKVYIEKLFRNIINNAITYGKEKGWIEISFIKDKHYVEIIIKDNGIGISKKDLLNIFKRFFRAEKSRNRAGGGTGLGLAIAKQIAQEHGGDIEASSVLGSGSTFTIILPLIKKIN